MKNINDTAAEFSEDDRICIERKARERAPNAPPEVITPEAVVKWMIQRDDT
jgi:hypothetical protein